METVDIQRRVHEVIAENGEFRSVTASINNRNRIITLRGKVRLRGQQIKIEESVGRIAEGFAVINLVKVGGTNPSADKH